MPDDRRDEYNMGMSQPKQGRQTPDPEREPSDEGGSSFAWEFVNDERMGQQPSAMPFPGISGKPKAPSRSRDQESSGEPRTAASGLPPSSPRPVAPVRPAAIAHGWNPVGAAKENYIRDQLDRSLDRWWALGELPPTPLLRDALLMLEAGGSVSESQRTLILRAALAYGRGVVTALRHQIDTERVALVLAEALVEWEVPLEAEGVAALVGGNAPVLAYLRGELERSRVLLTGEPRRRAHRALEVLESEEVSAGIAAPLTSPPLPSVPTLPVGRQRIRQILLLLLLLALVGFVLWQRRQQTPEGMIAMPAAAYALLGAEESSVPQSAQLDAFFIDRFEVTNREYRSCVAQGKCKWPLDRDGATRVDYFTNPAFDGYPVVYISQPMAAAYCVWQGKRLPTAGEWQAAASVSLATGQAFRFPWGATFEAQRTNSAAGLYDDTMPVGTFRPAGDSPSGAVDMAGNVAEWTATLEAGSDVTRAIVKGGSFASLDGELAVGAERTVEVGIGLAEVGFRCARSHLLTE